MGKKHKQSKQTKPVSSNQTHALVDSSLDLREFQIDYINQVTISETLGGEFNYLFSLLSSSLTFPISAWVIKQICSALEPDYDHLIKPFYIYNMSQIEDRNTAQPLSVNYLAINYLSLQMLSHFIAMSGISYFLLAKLFPKGVVNYFNKQLKQDLPEGDLQAMRSSAEALIIHNRKLIKTMHSILHAEFLLASMLILYVLSIAQSPDLIIYRNLIINNEVNETLVYVLASALPFEFSIIAPWVVNVCNSYFMENKSQQIEERNKQQKKILKKLLAKLALERKYSLSLKGKLSDLKAYFILTLPVNRNEQGILKDLAYILEQSLNINIIETSSDSIFMTSAIDISEQQLQQGVEIFQKRQESRKNNHLIQEKFEQLNILIEPLNVTEWRYQEIDIDDLPKIKYENSFRVDAERKQLITCLKSLYGEECVQEVATFLQVMGTLCATEQNLLKQRDLLEKCSNNILTIPTEENNAFEIQNPSMASSRTNPINWLPRWPWIDTTFSLFSRAVNQQQKPPSTTSLIQWHHKKYDDYAKAHPKRLVQLTFWKNNVEKRTNIFALFMKEKLERQADTTALAHFYEIFKRHNFLGEGYIPNQEGLKLNQEGKLEIKKLGNMGAFRPNGPAVTTGTVGNNDNNNNNNEKEKILYAISSFSKTH